MEGNIEKCRDLVEKLFNLRTITRLKTLSKILITLFIVYFIPLMIVDIIIGIKPERIWESVVLGAIGVVFTLLFLIITVFVGEILGKIRKIFQKKE